MSTRRGLPPPPPLKCRRRAVEEEETAYANISPDFSLSRSCRCWLSSAPVVQWRPAAAGGAVSAGGGGAGWSTSHTGSGKLCLSSGRSGQEGGAGGTGSTGYQDWGTRRRRGHAAITDGPCWSFCGFLLDSPPTPYPQVIQPILLQHQRPQ